MDDPTIILFMFSFSVYLCGVTGELAVQIARKLKARKALRVTA